MEPQKFIIILSASVSIVNILLSKLLIESRRFITIISASVNIEKKYFFRTGIGTEIRTKIISELKLELKLFQNLK